MITKIFRTKLGPSFIEICWVVYMDLQTIRTEGGGMVGSGKSPPTSCEVLKSFFLFNKFFFNWRHKFNKLKISYSISKKSSEIRQKKHTIIKPWWTHRFFTKFPPHLCQLCFELWCLKVWKDWVLRNNILKFFAWSNAKNWYLSESLAINAI